jgi:hypothetical protein
MSREGSHRALARVGSIMEQLGQGLPTLGGDGGLRSPRSVFRRPRRTSNPCSRSPVPMKADPPRARATVWETLRCFLTPADGVGFGEYEEVPLGPWPRGDRRYAGRGRHVCQGAHEREWTGHSQTAALAAYLNQALHLTRPACRLLTKGRSLVRARHVSWVVRLRGAQGEQPAVSCFS